MGGHSARAAGKPMRNADLPEKEAHFGTMYVGSEIIVEGWMTTPLDVVAESRWPRPYFARPRGTVPAIAPHAHDARGHGTRAIAPHAHDRRGHGTRDFNSNSACWESLIGVCMANDRTLPTTFGKNRPSVGRPRSLALQASIGIADVSVAQFPHRWGGRPKFWP